MINEGRTIYFRLVEESDAAFIHSLRMDEQYNKYLSQVDDDVEKQRQWITRYKQREEQNEEYYFIIHRKDNNLPIGTLRIYDFRPEENSFCWGSWILNENKTRYAALESAMCVYEFAFGELGYNRCHMDMRKENKGVIAFHQRFGIEIFDESEIDYFAYLYKDSYLKVRDEFFSFLDSHRAQ